MEPYSLNTLRFNPCGNPGFISGDSSASLKKQTVMYHQIKSSPVSSTSNLWQVILITFCLICNLKMSAQHAEIEGHTKIRGSIDITHMADSTSVIIGRKAALNLDVSKTRKNTVVGVKAGTVNTIGSFNTFMGHKSGESNISGSHNSFFGQEAGRSNTIGSDNCFFGQSAGRDNDAGYENAFFGQGSGQRNTEGSANSFYGYESGYRNISGNYNSFFGYLAGHSNTTGVLNSYFGAYSGFANLVGERNSFFGFSAGLDNKGSDNSFFGQDAGKANTSGYSNSFFGQDAGTINTTGYRNAFFGRLAGSSNSTGDHNSFFGSESGSSFSEGDYNSTFGSEAGKNFSNGLGTRNTFLGAQSGYAPLLGLVLDRSIAIGFKAEVACSNCAVIGGSGEDAVNVGIGTERPDSHKLHVASDDFTGAFIKGKDVALELGGSDSPYSGSGDDGVIRTQKDQLDGDMILVSNDFITLHLNDDNTPDNSKFEIRNGANTLILSMDENGDMTIAGNLTENSDARLKENLIAINSVLPKLMQIRGYRYNWKASANNKVQIGLIAQEVASIFPELVSVNEAGIQSINYNRFVPLLIECIREQQQNFDLLQARISHLEKMIR